MTLARQNLDNLSQFFRAMGAEQGQVLDHWWTSTHWPNRCWVDLDWSDSQLEPQQLEQFERQLLELHPRFTLSLWQRPGSNFAALQDIIEQQEFKLAYEQTAMVLSLDQTSPIKPCEEFLQPLSRSEISRWTETCSAAFHYPVNSDVIELLATQPQATLVKVEEAGSIAATAILWRSGEILGIHQLGVAPEFRRRGIARKLTEQIIARAQNESTRHITLQASKQGEGLYRQLGFKAQFLIRNYRRIPRYQLTK